MCYSSRVGVVGWGGGGGCIISAEHRVAFHMDFPCVLKLFGLRQSLLHAVNSALRLAARPFVLARLLCPGLFGRRPVRLSVLQGDLD